MMKVNWSPIVILVVGAAEEEIFMFADAATCAKKFACIYGAVLWHFSDCVGCIRWLYLFLLVNQTLFIVIIKRGRGCCYCLQV